MKMNGLLNGGVPLFPYGTTVLVDKTNVVKYARFSAGAEMEMDETGAVFHQSLVWADGTSGGNGFKGILNEVTTRLPNDGFVIFSPPTMKNGTDNYTRKNLPR